MILPKTGRLFKRTIGEYAPRRMCAVPPGNLGTRCLF